MRNILRWLALALLLTLPLSALAQDAADDAAPVLQVHQMMIGCADGYLLRLGDATVMIDGGNAIPEQPTDDVMTYLRQAGVDTLDAYIITHWHLDHCMNLNLVLQEFGGPDTVVYAPSPALHEDYAPLANGVYRQMKQGDEIQLGGFTITCIGPAQLSQNGRGNPDSLNFVVQYGQRRILFTGDFAQSTAINGEWRDLCAGVDVLKFPHHGLQPYEIGVQAMRIVRPQYVLVPGVASKHKIWDLFDDNGVKFPRDNVFTNADGHVVILTNGGDYFEVLTQQHPADYAPAP